MYLKKKKKGPQTITQHGLQLNKPPPEKKNKKRGRCQEHAQRTSLGLIPFTLIRKPGQKHLNAAAENYNLGHPDE